MNPLRLLAASRRWLSAAILLVLAGCAGDAAHRQGMEMFAQGRQEEGLAKLEQAAGEAPDNPVYRLAHENAKKRIAGRLLAEAQQEKSAGRLDAAETLYRRVITLDGGNPDGVGDPADRYGGA